MAVRTVETYTAGALTLREQWSNATQAGDPTPAGYTAFNPDGSIKSQRSLTAAESAQLADADTANTQAANESSIDSLLIAALAANRQDQTQDQAIITNAATITATSGTLTSAQLSNFVRQLAQAVSVLAQNDTNSKKEMNYLIRRVLQRLEATN